MRAIRNAPSIADGTDEIDFFTDADMRKLLGALPHDLIADVNGTSSFIDIENGKGHAEKLNGRLARNPDLNELTRMCGFGNTRGQHRHVIDPLGNLSVEEYGATFLKLLVHVLAFPSTSGST